jgi:hypothetical protein
MYLIVSKYLIPKGYTGLTFFPFIILKKKQFKADKFIVNHEKIHIRQQLEFLVIPFYFFYFLDFCYKLFIYKNKTDAYRNIVFERECYANEDNLSYLKTRKFWNFLNYLKK